MLTIAVWRHDDTMGRLETRDVDFAGAVRIAKNWAGRMKMPGDYHGYTGQMRIRDTTTGEELYDERF